MMKRFDGSIEERDLMFLENHLRICPDCRRQEASLHAMVRELERSRPAAPASIEKNVMQNICGENRGTAALLPYVVLPSALLVGILALLVYRAYMSASAVIVGRAAQAFLLLYEMYRSVAAVSNLVFNAPHMGPAIAAAGILTVAGIISLVFIQFGKNDVRRTYWRTVK